METIEELYKKYPKIFKLMDNSYYSISSGVPDTWLQTLDWLCGSIQDYIDNCTKYRNGEKITTPQVVCEQVKEKFGGLRFYYSGGDDEVEGMVKLAETIIWNTCQSCGNHEQLETTKGWISRICKTCKNKEDEYK